MNTYNIAGLKVNMSPYGKTLNQAEKYLTQPDSYADIVIDFEFKKIQEYAKSKGFDTDTAYYLASGFYFYRNLLKFDGFMLHSSAVCVDGGAYLFSGQPGIGKSTHTDFWKQLLGDRCVVINDDKPAIRIIDGIVYACGTPWSGKKDVSTNTAVPVRGLCFMGRGEKNTIERLSKPTAAMRIIDQCPKNFNEEQWDKLLKLIDIIVDNVPVYKLNCRKDISAAKLSYKTLSGEKI